MSALLSQGTESGVPLAPEVDAVYIPLPNRLHVEWSLKAMQAGKHVMCERPMTMQAADFDRLIAACPASTS